MSTVSLQPARWQLLLRHWLLPWGLFVAALLNGAYPTYRHYDFSHSPDTRTYLALAAGRLSDSLSVTRRYRLPVPLAAGALARPLAVLGGHAWPPGPPGEWPLRTAFYLLNCALLAAAATAWYRAARLAGAGAGWAAGAGLAALSSRWAGYAAGLPLTDSLYWLVLALAYYAGRRRGPGAGWAVAAALLLGPLAKESFALVLPWLAWYGRPALRWRWQALALAGGLAALLLAHRWLDAAIGAPAGASVRNALGHFENVGYSLGKLATAKGLAEAASSFGLLWLPVLAALAWPAGRRALAPVLRPAEGWWLLLVAAHMLLSADLGRMGFLAAPVVAVALALVLRATMRQLADAPDKGRASNTT